LRAQRVLRTIARGFHFVCAGSALQDSKHDASIRRDARCGIHDVKQRTNYTTMGAPRVFTAATEFNNTQRKLAQSSEREDERSNSRATRNQMPG
jgi:hypothetical protein